MRSDKTLLLGAQNFSFPNWCYGVFNSNYKKRLIGEAFRNWILLLSKIRSENWDEERVSLLGLMNIFSEPPPGVKKFDMAAWEVAGIISRHLEPGTYALFFLGLPGVNMVGKKVVKPLGQPDSLQLLRHHSSEEGDLDPFSVSKPVDSGLNLNERERGNARKYRPRIMDDPKRKGKLHIRNSQKERHNEFHQSQQRDPRNI